MTTFQELMNAMAVAESRAGSATDRFGSRAVRVWAASNDLWSDEYHAWRALSALGLENAAECAWRRRTAAADLSSILLKAAL